MKLKVVATIIVVSNSNRDLPNLGGAIAGEEDLPPGPVPGSWGTGVVQVGVLKKAPKSA